MTDKKYTIYDQEPIQILIDVPLLFAFIFFSIFLIVIPLSADHNKAFTIILIILVTCVWIYLLSLWSKFVTSNKLVIRINEEYLEIFSRKKPYYSKMPLNEIIKMETASIGRFTHYKIYLRDNKIFAISKFALYWICDDLNRFKKDLEKTLKNH